jgi:hypothetical protein
LRWCNGTRAGHAKTKRASYGSIKALPQERARARAANKEKPWERQAPKAFLDTNDILDTMRNRYKKRYIL